VEPGAILLGKYRVDEVLGTGGMGRVVRAWHHYLNQPVAIKILHPHMAASAETVSRFLREAQANVMLRSEHIARVLDVGTLADGVPFMVMEYLDGYDLNQILRHHGPQLPKVVCDLMLQACEGIAEAHGHGIVHRDIKPSNFFITRRPDGSMLLKILDFGISKSPIGATELTDVQAVIGTPTYMSPEQMKSGRSADARSDIWSMGVVMYQLICGRPPFVGDSFADLANMVDTDEPPPLHVQVPPGLDEVILRCLAKSPADRQQDVGELARMLAPFATEPGQAAQSASRTTRILQHKRTGALQGSPLTAAGGRLTPLPPSLAPASPPAAWPPPRSESSLSHGRGQVTHTHRVRGARARPRLIVAVSLLCVAAAAGGFTIAELTRPSDGEAQSDREHPRVIAPAARQPAPSSAPRTPAPAPAPAPASARTAVVDEPPPSASNELPTPPSPEEPSASVATSDPEPPTPPVAKPAPTPPGRSTGKPRPRIRRDGDLFDTRK
jgi:serine/threonine protein kinase